MSSKDKDVNAAVTATDETPEFTENKEKTVEEKTDKKREKRRLFDETGTWTGQMVDTSFRGHLPRLDRMRCAGSRDDGKSYRQALRVGYRPNSRTGS